MSEVVTFELSGAVATVTLERPEKLNAINSEMLHGLLDALGRVAAEPGARALIVTGRGRAFSAGGDIADMEEMDETGFSDTIQLYMRLSQAFHDLPKITIAAVNGYALAGGFELALMCDLRICGASATFGLPDAALGLSPTSGMTWLLPRSIGLGRALHLTLTGERIDGREAERIGLVSAVVEDAQLQRTARELAEKVTGHPPAAVANTKAAFLAAAESGFAAATAFEARMERDCFRSGETKKAFADFLARRRGQ